ncbi:MAG: hypothetical protein U0L51_02975 [Olegusella sp.]|nr:hypothetical protein [Olegusella sp.]
MPPVADIARMLEGLDEEDRRSASDYVVYLFTTRGQRRAARTQRAFDQVDSILDGDGGWESEEDMVSEMAEFRRSRQLA